VGLGRLAPIAAVIVALVLSGCSQSTAAGSDSPISRAIPTATLQPTVVDSPTVRAVPTPTPPSAEAEGVACPSGVVNDPYPGHCKRYVDANNNGLCDLSELGSGDVEPRVRVQ
jgi:hypothetical protein